MHPTATALQYTFVSCEKILCFCKLNIQSLQYFARFLPGWQLDFSSFLQMIRFFRKMNGKPSLDYRRERTRESAEDARFRPLADG